ncbi:hypothetical protein EVAR_30805_1 [Eumeta japonica]|uniref:Uncharacterized protein n=1 Tax=Eumeta variegata TaxID=151549 RepID=A0A4C1V622_EUMVA|nr:hypothetical protein EVAR_30805_1 [Eumeta japonica]
MPLVLTCSLRTHFERSCIRLRIGRRTNTSRIQHLEDILLFIPVAFEAVGFSRSGGEVLYKGIGPEAQGRRGQDLFWMSPVPNPICGHPTLLVRWGILHYVKRLIFVI